LLQDQVQGAGEAQLRRELCMGSTAPVRREGSSRTDWRWILRAGKKMQS